MKLKAWILVYLLTLSALTSFYFVWGRYARDRERWDHWYSTNTTIIPNGPGSCLGLPGDYVDCPADNNLTHLEDPVPAWYAHSIRFFTGSGIVLATTLFLAFGYVGFVKRYRLAAGHQPKDHQVAWQYLLDGHLWLWMMLIGLIWALLTNGY